MRVLHIVPSLNYGASTAQLSVLARHLPRTNVEQRICVLRGVDQASLKQANGVDVDMLNWTRPLNPLPLLRLRRLIRSWQPHLIHTWQMPSARALALAGKPNCNWIVHGVWSGRLGKLDAWLLRRARRVIAGGSAQADWLRANGVRHDKIVVVRPGVQTPNTTLPEGSRLSKAIVCAGMLERHKGYHDAIWTADILKYIFDDIHLDVIGDGPDRDRLEGFVHAIRAGQYVHFRGWRASLLEDLARADVVWVPSLRDSGVNVALEAMSLGRPVVASAVGTLAEIVQHGETGFLVPPRDKAALARCTRLLFDNPSLRAGLAAAGRERARTQFSAAKMADCFSQLYQDLAA